MGQLKSTVGSPRLAQIGVHGDASISRRGRCKTNNRSSWWGDYGFMRCRDISACIMLEASPLGLGISPLI